MNERSKNIAIGSVVVISLTLLVWILLFLHPSFGDEKFKLHARFTAIDKISTGSKVTYAGRPVGKVLNIEYLPQGPREAGNPDAPIYIYDLLLGIDSSISVYNCDEISIGTSGLMGERFISIVPKHPKNGPARLLSTDEIIFADKAIDTQDVIEQLAKTVANLEQITSSLTHTEMIPKLITSATIMCDNLKILIDKVSSQEGSIGKILEDDEFYSKAMDVLNRTDLLMSDINQYGALFHLNKTWQRESRKRAEKQAKNEPKQAIE